MRGIHRSPVKSPHKVPVTRKMFPLMTSSWKTNSTKWSAKRGCDSWDEPYFNGLMQDCNISSTLAMEMLQSCTKTSICHSNLDGCIFSGLIDSTRSGSPYHFSMFCRAPCWRLRQGCSIASESAMGILQSFTKPSIWFGGRVVYYIWLVRIVLPICLINFNGWGLRVGSSVSDSGHLQPCGWAL